jgi:hypothetical protein
MKFLVSQTRNPVTVSCNTLVWVLSALLNVLNTHVQSVPGVAANKTISLLLLRLVEAWAANSPLLVSRGVGSRSTKIRAFNRFGTCSKKIARLLRLFCSELQTAIVNSWVTVMRDDDCLDGAQKSFIILPLAKNAPGNFIHLQLLIVMVWTNTSIV